MSMFHRRLAGASPEPQMSATTTAGETPTEEGTSNSYTNAISAAFKPYFRREFVVKKRLKFTALAIVLLAVRRLCLIIGATIDGGPPWNPDWVVAHGTRPTAIIMLADHGKKVRPLRSASITDKIEYANRHGYSLVVCPYSLDTLRPTQWSKLRLVYLALQQYNTILWLDIDTLIWNRNTTIETVITDKYTQDFVAQIDIRRSKQSRYFNSGVFMARKSDWTFSILRQAYQQWQVVLGKGILFFNTDQEGLNIAINKTTNFDQHVYVANYAEFWTLPKDHQSNKPWILHFPNCLQCAQDFLNFYEKTKDMIDAMV